eukprot:CAMPEP_0194768934 /NCGR_PEP_ID=MMETSP0323_2-20130528/41300_1 /TAXON_ID=2866 ORGANISM="Crypthecodinium cohnii, Strain Seligo" /NCGR_SAMPLE_ID=MMETSP0323_2 /ASSEMBLY_ACC=CAM_ASM_000346 /LENGTH=71 /DNA_ID=CAMNT_0039701609 /DNA_START=236 /DNA_END=451 /DNA_ORIENTATION=-
MLCHEVSNPRAPHWTSANNGVAVADRQSALCEYFPFVMGGCVQRAAAACSPTSSEQPAVLPDTATEEVCHN